MNDLVAESVEINIISNPYCNKFEANKEAIDRIKALSNSDFEKEISKFPEDTQMFMRLAREHVMD